MIRFSRAHRIITIALVSVWALSLGARPAAANPFDQTVAPLQSGDRVPPGEYVDQDGHRFSFDRLGSATTLVAFVYTRCTDACPLITHKIADVRSQLGAGPYRYVEVSIDPARDTVPALKAYATANHVAAPGWEIITGSPRSLAALWRAAGVSVIDNGKGDLIHNDRLLIIAPGGTIADIIAAVDWQPREVAAQMRHVAGQASNPIARADLALTKVVAQFCGGSYRTASGLIDAAVAVMLVALFAGIFFWSGRRLFVQGA